MILSSLDVVFCDHYDGHRSFYIVGYYTSSERVDGRYLHDERRLFVCDHYSAYNRDFSKIVNLCTLVRYSRTVVDTSRINYESVFGYKRNPLFAMHYGFCSAADIRVLCRALDEYGIKYKYAEINYDDLPF